MSYPPGFIAQRNQVGVRDFGTTVTIPNNPKAKLMYYLKSVSTVLELNDPALGRLTNYNNYYILNDIDIDVLLTMVCLFSPDKLIGKVFFHSEDCGGSNNQLLELAAVTHTLAVANSIIINGERKRVAKIMLFRRVWLEANYFAPMRAFQGRLARLARGLPGRPPSPVFAPRNANSRACTIQ